MNNLKINLVIIYCLFLPPLFISCKKATNPGHEVIPDEIKQWYLYQKGSYWIYQNEKTLQIDCTYISKDPSLWQKNFYKDDGSLNGIEDHIDISYNGIVYQSCNIAPEDVKINQNIAFNTNIPEGHKLILGIDTFEFVHHYDSLAIDNHSFHDVRLTRYSTTLSYNKSFAVNFFFARHIGLIRVSQSISSMDTTWSLLRYYIVQ